MTHPLGYCDVPLDCFLTNGPGAQTEVTYQLDIVNYQLYYHLLVHP